MQNPEAEDMCQRLRVAIKVGASEEEEFYKVGDSIGCSFIAIKWRRKNANQCDFALYGDVSQVKRVNDGQNFTL